MRSLVALGLVILCACSPEAARETVKNPKLIELGTIHEEKIQPGFIRVLGGSDRDTFTFSGNEVVKAVDIYPGPEGGTPVITVFYKGTYSRGNDIGNETFEINLNYNTVELVARNEDAVKLLNGLNFCGKNDFAIGVNANLTNSSAEALCPLDDTPTVVYDIYKVEGDRVFFGKGDKTSAEKRPKELDRDAPFIKR
jgi:hypothetical protein